jgi:hypothetical protein
MLTNIQSLFADILQTPEQRAAQLANQGLTRAELSTRGLSGGGAMLSPLIASSQMSAPTRSAMTRRAVGNLFGQDTRTESEQVQSLLSQADTSTPEGQQELLAALRNQGYGAQAAQYQQMLLAQQQADEDRLLEREAMQANIERTQADAERLTAERNRIVAQGNSDEARFAITAERIGDLIVGQDSKGTISVRTFDGRELKGEEATEALAKARSLEVEQKRLERQAQEAGTQTARLSTESFNQAQNLTSQLGRYREAIQAIDDGALSGALAQFLPTFRESTIRLQQVQTELGLGVISETTFGSLSEGELRLAISVNAPNLPPAELRKWYDDKIEATKKLQDAMYEQAIYFGGGGTVQGWLERQRDERNRREALEASTAPRQSSQNTLNIGQETVDREATISEILNRAGSQTATQRQRSMRERQISSGDTR